MSATTDIYVTPSTSLILIKSLRNVTNVYLREYNVPSFSITIRDTTGSSSITTNPVNISTISTARFLDGTSYYALNQPYGLVNISLRTSNVWQINHTSGQQPATAAANIGTLNVSTSYLNFVSSSKKEVSTFIAESFFTPNSIAITSPFIVSNLSTLGFTLIKGNLNVFGNATISGGMFIEGSVNIISSLVVQNLLPLSSPVTVFSSVGVGEFVNVGQSIRITSTLTLRSTIQVSTLQTTLSTLDTAITLTDSLRVQGVLSTLGDLNVGKTLIVGNDATFTQTLSSLGGTLSTLRFFVRGDTFLENNLSIVSTVAFASTVVGQSTGFIAGNAFFNSNMGTQGVFTTSSIVASSFSTFGSLYTKKIELLSTATVTGNFSTSLFQSYQYFSVGGNVFTPGTLSSQQTTIIQGFVTAREGGVAATAHTSSSVGVGKLASVTKSTLTGYVEVGCNVGVGNIITTTGFTNILGSVGIGSNTTIVGNLTVIGTQEISSFSVQSFLLSNVQIQASSPTTSVRISSLYASSIQTEFTRISAPLPDILTVSTVYASTLQTVDAKAENATTEFAIVDSFFGGSTLGLAESADPKFVLNIKSDFVQGVSTLEVRANTVESLGTIEGSFVGDVFYLSNVGVPFANLSATTSIFSTISVEELYVSSFSVSTFINHQYLNVVSSLSVPHLLFQTQGFPFQQTMNQFLTVDSQHMFLNQNLYFDRSVNRIGLFTSTPAYDFDISGLVYVSSIYYSSINSLYVSSVGRVLFSTIYTSSSYVANSLQHGPQGLRIFSQNQYTSNTYSEINTTVSSFSNLFGMYDCIEQSTILLNSAVHIHRQNKVGINTATTAGEFLPLLHDLTVVDTIRTEEGYFSTLTLSQSLQTTSYISPYLLLNSNGISPINTISSAIDRISVDGLMTVTTRKIGIYTLNPECMLDIRGTAYFSTLSLLGNTYVDYVGMSFQEI